MADKDNPENEIIARLEKLEAESVIKDSMIIEYRNALSEAQYKIAVLNGQRKLAQASKEPTD